MRGSPQRQSHGSRIAIITSVLSLVIAAFGAAYTVLRAREEEQSQLRSEAAESVRRLAELGPRTDAAAVDEREVIIAQLRKVVDSLESAPSAHLRQLSLAYRANTQYRESERVARRAIAVSKRDGDALGGVLAFANTSRRSIC